MRILLLVALIGWQGAAFAAQGCSGATPQAKSGEMLVDWYDNFIRPYRYLPANEAMPKSTKAEVEAFMDRLAPFNRRASLDQLELEHLVRQVMASYAKAPDFSNIDNAAVEKLYKSDSGDKVDFSLFCISPRTLNTPNDAFGVTLFGVVADDCQHVGLRGLVFTSTLINGRANGQCRPDLVSYKLFALPLQVGLNEITLICGKDTGGCAH
jgi:hypothetical protein